MTTTLNKAEVLHRAYALAKDYASASYEMGQAQNFIRDLCEVFGFSAKRLVNFEQRVKKASGSSGRMDGFYPGKLLIEMKSRGEDLQAAYQQALDYLPGLQDAELPDYHAGAAHQSPPTARQSRRCCLRLQSRAGRCRPRRLFVCPLPSPDGGHRSGGSGQTDAAAQGVSVKWKFLMLCAFLPQRQSAARPPAGHPA